MFRHNVDYKGDTNEKTNGSNNYPSETDGCVSNPAEEYENEEDDEFKEDTSEINDTNESKISKGKTEEDVIRSMFAKKISLKVTKVRPDEEDDEFK